MTDLSTVDLTALTLADLADIRGVNLAKLAASTNLSASTVYRINRNPSSARMSAAMKIGARLGVGPRDVMSLKSAHVPLPIMARIREARRAKGMSQTQLGELVGLSFAAISGYELGLFDPPSDILNAMIEHLDLIPRSPTNWT